MSIDVSNHYPLAADRQQPTARMMHEVFMSPPYLVMTTFEQLTADNSRLTARTKYTPGAKWTAPELLDTFLSGKS
jgi:hypothetical protein